MEFGRECEVFPDTMFLSPCRFLLQFSLDPKQKPARRDEAKRKREPILASRWDDMNPSITDGNPADKRMLRNSLRLILRKNSTHFSLGFVRKLEEKCGAEIF